MPIRRSFLVVYDYGMGGVWGIAVARSAEEIVSQFPELKVVERKPAWMSEARYRELQKTPFEIGTPKTYPDWLRAVISDRKE